MALTVIETPGASDANSYVSLEEANEYMLTRLHSEAWEGFDDEQKKAGIISATAWLDAMFNWTGTAVDCIQSLGWPRNGMFSRNGCAIDPAIIPVELKRASSEFAISLATEQRTADIDAQNQGLSEIEAGPVRLKFTDRAAGTSLALSSPDLAYMSRFIPDAVRALIPPSWYMRPAAASSDLLQSQVHKGFFFRVDR